MNAKSIEGRKRPVGRHKLLVGLNKYQLRYRGHLLVFLIFITQVPPIRPGWLLSKLRMYFETTRFHETADTHHKSKTDRFLKVESTAFKKIFALAESHTEDKLLVSSSSTCNHWAWVLVCGALFPVFSHTWVILHRKYLDTTHVSRE